MRIFPPPLDIGDKEGFSPEKDIFGRSKLGAGLQNLVSSATDPTVIAVDGQWGSGKTTFLKMWAGELRKAGFPVVYFDAFESDYLDDAFMAIASEIISLAQAKKKENSPKAKRFVDSAVGASKVLMRSGLKLGVKAATLGAVAAADIEEMGEDIAKEAGNLTDKYLGDLLTKQKEVKQSIGQFRAALSELPELLTEKDKDADDSNPEAVRPLIFIIDELDRCRPSFALEILERTKHFFAVPNVHFVLGVHLGQLKNSIVAEYGPNIDANTYLQKFVHLTYHLVDDARYDHERIVPKFVNYLVKSLEFKNEDGDTVNSTTEIVEYVAQQQNLSLRAIERIMTTLAISLACTPKNYIRVPPIIGGLCILKTASPDLFVKAKQGLLTYKEVTGALGFETTTDKSESLREWYIKWWRFCLDDSFDQEEAARLSQSLWRYNTEPSGIVRLTANNIVDRLVPRE